MSYLIKDTTREERLNYVQNAIAIMEASQESVNPKLEEILMQYVEGLIEIKDIKKTLKERYLNGKK